MPYHIIKHYELKDHLGNVRATVSDRKSATLVGGSLTNGVELLSANNYYPFGMLQSERTFNATGHRYGFQGQEMDNEIKGEGNSLNYKFRMHDPRLGRFFAVV